MPFIFAINIEDGEIESRKDGGDMKRKTYNNVMKATKMIQKKGYGFEEASQMAIKLFDEHTKEMNSIEFYIDKILDKETEERESELYKS